MPELSNMQEVDAQEVSADKLPNFVINPKHNILNIDLNGTWNQQVTLDFIAEYKRLAHRSFAQEWACVMNLKGLELLLSESFQIESFKALNAWSYIKGMKASAVIISSCNRSHLLYQFEEIFKVNHPYVTSVCHSRIEADQWLVEQGFQQKSQSLSAKPSLSDKVIASSQKKYA